MTVSTTLDRQYFNGNGTNRVFPFNFRFLSSSQIVVTLIGPAPNYAVTPQVLNVDFTVTGENSQTGGTVTMSVAPPTGTQNLLIQRILPIVQPQSIRNQGRFFPAVHEDTFDYLTLLIQQVAGVAGNALQLDFTRRFFDFRGLRGINAGNPVLPQDVTTKSYVDGGDSAVLAEANERIDLEEQARQSADANLQAQMTGNVPLEASAFSEISWHGQVIGNSVVIPPNKNAWSFGPAITIALGQVVTVSEGSFWTVANGVGSGTINGDSDFGTLPIPDYGDSTDFGEL